MASVRLTRVTKSFQKGTTAIRDLDLEILDGEFLVLVGPSGCGKSTTLRMIAGLEDPTEGEIHIGDRNVTAVPPKERDIAMVFQNYALYPHMNVYENMAFGLKLRKFSRQEIEARVREAAQILEIEELFKRKPKELSGGQRQRVALGRAIVRKPNVFLFDEPLSNLDAKLRVQMRTEIKKLHLRLKTTMIYVTHDQVEAMTMGDRIVVMRSGVIHQIDDPLRLYNHPADLFVAGFIGSPSMNFLPALLRGDPLRAEEGMVTILLPPEQRERLKDQIGKEIVVGLRPEDLHVEPPPETRVSEITLRHEVSELMGNETYLYLTTGRTPIICRAPQFAKSYAVDETVTLYCDLGKLHYFEKDTQRAL